VSLRCSELRSAFADVILYSKAASVWAWTTK
jgi:hypothetical protein